MEKPDACRSERPPETGGITATHPWADHPDLVEYYANHRHRSDELYPSERRFLPWLADRAGSVLDVGCGAGGFSEIWRSHTPTIRYTGIDVSAPLIEAARASYPEHRFLKADCAEGLPIEAEAADVVAALGWLHWEPRYARALMELWRVTKQYLFFDLRLVDRTGPSISGTQRLALVGDWDGQTTVPYICAPWPEIAALLLGLGPSLILGYGYWGPPAGTVVGVNEEICFATFVLKRSSTARLPATEVALELPVDWPAQLRDRVTLAGADRLGQLVPQSDEALG